MASCLKEVVLGVGHDGAVRCSVRDAGKGKASGELVVVKEALLGVVHLASGHLARAGGARASAARVREVDASLLGYIEDVLVARAFNHLLKSLRTVRETNFNEAKPSSSTCSK